MTPTLETLRLHVARMLPEHLELRRPVWSLAIDVQKETCVASPINERAFWKDTHKLVTDREWQHCCWLAEQTLDTATRTINEETNLRYNEWHHYLDWLCAITKGNTSPASAEHRLEALCRVKFPELFHPKPQ